MGFVFLNAVDDLFVYATLPAGWDVQVAEIGKAEYVLDEVGRRRAAILLPGAYGRRHSEMISYSFYKLAWPNIENLKKGDAAVVQAVDFEGTPVFSVSGPIDSLLALDEVVISWLNTNRPEWRDRLAYWDEY